MFVLPRYLGGSIVNSESPLTVSNYEVELVDHFCHLGCMLSCEGGADRAPNVGILTARRKLREISTLPTNNHIPLISRRYIENGCVRSEHLLSLLKGEVI